MNAAIKADPYVVGNIEESSLEFLGHHCVLADGKIDQPKFVELVGTGPEPAFVVEAQTVQPPRRLKKRRKPAIDAPIHDAIVRLVGELDVTLSVDQGAFGEFEPIGKLFELRPWRDDGRLS